MIWLKYEEKQYDCLRWATYAAAKAAVYVSRQRSCNNCSLLHTYDQHNVLFAW